MTQVAFFQSKLLSVVRSYMYMHLFPKTGVAIWRAVVYCARAAQAFSAGLYCRNQKNNRHYNKYKQNII